MALKQTMEFRDEARSNPMDALKMARGPQGLQAAPPQGATGGMSPGAMGGQAPIPQFVPDEPPRQPKITKVGQILDRQVIDRKSVV